LFGIVNPFVDSFFRFLVLDVYERSKKIVVGFVGMWIPRSGIQAIVGSVGKSQDFSMLSTMASFPRSLCSEEPDAKPRLSDGWWGAGLCGLPGIMGFVFDSPPFFCVWF
jgi:hypothetical protein